MGASRIKVFDTTGTYLMDLNVNVLINSLHFDKHRKTLYAVNVNSETPLCTVDISGISGVN